MDYRSQGDTRVTINGSRHYKTPYGALPSVTTILSETQGNKAALERWAKKNPGGREAAAARGTKVHSLMEEYLLGIDKDPVIDDPEIAQFWDANPGKFGFNYENGGSGPSFFQNVLRVMGTADFTSGDSSPEKIAKLKPGIDFFNKYADKYIITAGNADSIHSSSETEIWLAPAWEDHLAGLQKRGEVRKEIKMYIPSMGMNGGGNGVAIPKNAPNPHAALVFANWLLSAETQTGFNRDFGAAPLHPEADDSSALISNAQRAYRQNWASNPFSKDLADHFIEEVMMNR